MCLSVHRGRGLPASVPDRDPPNRDPLDRDPPRTETPLDRDPLDTDSPRPHGKDRVVRILLECILVVLCDSTLQGQSELSTLPAGWSRAITWIKKDDALYQMFLEFGEMEWLKSGRILEEVGKVDVRELEPELLQVLGDPLGHRVQPSPQVERPVLRDTVERLVGVWKWRNRESSLLRKLCFTVGRSVWSP